MGKNTGLKCREESRLVEAVRRCRFDVYGKTGHLTKIIDNLNNNKNREYEFDAVGRLAKAKGGPTGNLWNETYSYDRWGNRLQVKLGNGGVATDGTSPMPIGNLCGVSWHHCR